MFKPFRRIQVKIYSCGIDDSVFLAAQLVSCNELHFLLTLFDQAHSVTKLWLVTGRVSTICCIVLESYGTDSSFLLNLGVPPMDVTSTILSCPAVIFLEVTQLRQPLK